MTYQELLQQLDTWFTDATMKAGPGVVLCRQGCAHCCHGPFDISAADAELVSHAVNQLDDVTRHIVTARAADHLRQQAAHLAGWTSPWDSESVSEDDFDAMGDALAELPCPALNPSGHCVIYASRPATCRMTGMPMGSLTGDVIENACPIIDTSAAYAALAPAIFDIGAFENASESREISAMERGWVPTTVAGAIAR